MSILSSIIGDFSGAAKAKSNLKKQKEFALRPFNPVSKDINAGYIKGPAQNIENFQKDEIALKEMRKQPVVKVAEQKPIPKTPKKDKDSYLSDTVIPTTPKEYTPIINQASKLYGVPANLLSGLLEHESAYWSPKAINNVLASGTGIGQWTGIAIEEMNRLGYQNSDGTSFNRASALDPVKAVPATAYFLNVMKDRFGTWEEAVRNYNGNNALMKNGQRVKDYYVEKIWSKLY